MIGFLNDKKLLHFTHDIVEQATNKYSISDAIDKYEVALLNFGYLALESMPSTWNDLFVNFVGLSVLDHASNIYESWEQIITSDTDNSYLKDYASSLLSLGNTEIPQETIDSLLTNVSDYAKDSESIYDFISMLSNASKTEGYKLDLPNSFV